MLQVISRSHGQESPKTGFAALLLFPYNVWGHKPTLFCEGGHNWRGKKRLGYNLKRRFVQEKVPKEMPFTAVLAIDFRTDYRWVLRGYP